MKVLVDARRAARGLGIATFVERLTEGFGALEDVSVHLWQSSESSGRLRLRLLGELKRSGPFDVAPGLDPRTRGFDVVHFASNMCSVRPGPHSIVTLHDLLYRNRGRRRDRLLGALFERGLLRAGRIVAVSARTRYEADQTWPGLGAAIDVIPHGMRRLPPPTGPREHILAFGGASDPRKRTDLIVEVYRQYRRAVSDPLPLVVLGRAGLTDDQQSELTALDAEVVTSASRDTVDRLMGSAGAVLYTSIAEGFGLPIVEAAEMGTPVVMDDAADLASEVRGRHCYLVDGSCIDAWADGLERAVSGGPIFGALDLPDWVTTASRYVDHYRRVCA